jgi:hypothetical protein
MADGQPERSYGAADYLLPDRCRGPAGEELPPGRVAGVHPLHISPAYPAPITMTC